MSNKRESSGHVVFGRKKQTVESTMTFEFHNIEDALGQASNLETDKITCMGYDWWIKVQKTSEKRIVVFLYCSGSDQNDVSVKVGSTWTDSDGKCDFCKDYHLSFTSHNSSRSLGAVTEWKMPNAVIEVKLLLVKPKDPVWYPKPLNRCELVKNMLENESNTDITIEVEGKDSAVHKFPAHKVVLEDCAHQLVKFAVDGAKEVPGLQKLEPETVRRLLHFIYKGETPDSPSKECLMKLLEAAHFSDCPSLKVQLESEIVDSDILSINNAALLLVEADRLVCPYVKEACLKLLTGSPAEAEKSEGWDNIGEKLLKELWSFKFHPTFYDVASVREQLEEKGLSLDGTYLMLRKRLETHKAADVDNHLGNDAEIAVEEQD